jgi:hypothetical protein
MQEQLQKACRWLNKKAQGWPVGMLHPEGYAIFGAYVFRVERPSKPSVWYVMDMDKDDQWKVARIKRICV